MKKFSVIKKIYEQEIQLSQVSPETPEEEVKSDVTPDVTTSDETSTEQSQVGEVTKSEPSKFFSKIFEARQMAHVYHLQVKGDVGSHATHTALNDYYDGLLDILDELIETYQGQYEVVEEYDIIDTKNTKSKEVIEYFIELNQFIKDTRGKAFIPEDTHLQNIIDEIVAMTYRLLYKLKYNK